MKKYYLVETDRFGAYPEVKAEFTNKRNAVSECKRRKKASSISNSLYNQHNMDRFHVVTSIEVDEDYKILNANVIE